MTISSSVSRRRLLQTLAAGATSSCIPDMSAFLKAGSQVATPEKGQLIPDNGWRLWVDSKADWQEDEIYLPEEVTWQDGKLCGKGRPLPVNAPTGGWDVLSATAGIEVTLPASVEQHLWGKYGAGEDGKPRPYTPQEYRYAATTPPVPPADDAVPQNGAYFGVSWFFRTLPVAAAMRGKQVFLHIRGAHLRAEVYCNGKLCGYSIMEELPFEADLTGAVRPGADNLLSLRITNPFGRFDWVDGANAKWGKLALYRSHGFGALDRGISLSAHSGRHRIVDLWALNTPDAHKLLAHVRVEGEHPAVPRFDLLEPETGRVLASTVAQPTDRAQVYTAAIPLLNAKLWDLQQPNLYHLRASIPGTEESLVTVCAFRSFGPTGLGDNALFRLNGRRIRLYTAISWGFWGLNGMFPVPELAEKEVMAAQALGLNCLNFHRNLAKEDVLRAHDRLGMLRYMEPGAGKLAIGKLPANAAVNAAGTVMEEPRSEADRFAQRYMFIKCVEMVKAFRAHPSVIEYCLQNEIGADLHNPTTLAVLKAMHDEDPSRAVLLNDGFVARGAAQAWFEPWSDDLRSGQLHRSDQEKWGDWWNNHQGAGDQWYDQFYKSPTEYTYKAPYRDVLTEYGEMEGCARPDNHPLMIHQIRQTYARYGGTSYDLQDHEEIVAGYERFLDRWGFRKAFPTSESLFRALGRTCYDSWMNYMENARISDELDFAAISGWESTAIENHSGIVDNLRNHKADPELIRGSLLPVRPIAKQRSLVIAQGQPAIFDLFLANDTSLPAQGTLTLTMVTPSRHRQELVTVPAPAHSKDQFSYLLHTAFATPPLTEEGLYRFHFALSSAPLATQTKELWVTLGVLPAGKPRRIAVAGIPPALRADLAKLVPLSDFQPGTAYDLIVTAGLTEGASAVQNVGETTGEQMPAPKPGHTPEPGETAQSAVGHFAPGILDAVRNGTALLAIPQADTLSDGLARELANTGAFTYNGTVGDFRAPWMGNWYFVREHALFAGMPVNQAMGLFYQVPGRQSNGLLVERAPAGQPVEIVVGYSRDHDRGLGAGTFTTRLGAGKLLFHRVPAMHSVMQQRFLANAIRWLTA